VTGDTELMEATHVRPGDWIVWCGRSIRVVDTKPAFGGRSRARAGTYLICDLSEDGPESLRQLHYATGERVTVIFAEAPS
jgi:hypothetical protein